MYCEIHGSRGPAVPTIHGNGGSIATFKQNIPYFAGRYRVILADSRAQGRSGATARNAHKSWTTGKEKNAWQLFMLDWREPNIPSAALRAVRGPAPIVCGDHDLVSLEHTVEIYRSRPHATLWVVSHSGHATSWNTPTGSTALWMTSHRTRSGRLLAPSGNAACPRQYARPRTTTSVANKRHHDRALSRGETCSP